MSEYTIRKLEEDDWEIFRQVRLKALATDPLVFGSNYDREADQPVVQWQESLGDEAVAIFVLFARTLPMGITGVSVYRDDPSNRTAILWGSWLEPEIRGKGLSKMFYKARINWAREHPTVARLIISHRASNLASRSANQKFGFSLTHVTEKVWNDGITEEEFHYELIL
ncbi:MAG: GNAT family N-acetyltransferase [Chloracidobacterium sp.]|nr:GNAT family N-acetyltransferase [Chloracidobacterium sp.]